MTTTPESQKMRFRGTSARVSAHVSRPRCKQAQIALDTDMAGNPDAFHHAA